MEAPTLSKKQQKKALSGKKQTHKSLRNVLATPYSNYWPQLEEADERELCNILERLLPSARCASRSIPWSELQKIPREERLEKKHALLQQTCPESKKLRQFLLIGVNSVTRALEKGQASCVLISLEVDPLLMIRHIITLCSHSKVPVLLVSSLKTVTRTCLGFPTMTIGLKKCVAVTEDNHFYGVHQKVCELAAGFPWREPEVLFHSSSEEDNMDIEATTVVQPSAKLMQPSTDVYKYRTSCKERVFIPKLGAVQVEQEADFLRINSSGPESSEEENQLADTGQKGETILGRGISNVLLAPADLTVLNRGNRKKNKMCYKNTIVKRLQPNPNKIRKKKKMEKGQRMQGKT